MKFKLLFILLTSITFSLVGQTIIQKDSLSTYTFDELSDKFYSAKPDSLKAVLYAKYIINKATQEKDTLQTADGHYYLSDITQDSTYFINYWNHIIQKTSRLNNRLYPAISYLQVGEFYHHKGQKEVALKNYLLSNNSIFNNDSLLHILKQKIAVIKSSNNRHTEALKLYKEAYNYYKRNTKKRSKKSYPFLLINLTSVYNKLKKTDSAKHYNDLAYDFAIKHNDSVAIGYALYKRGEILYRLEDYPLAINNFMKSIPIIIKDENFSHLSNSFYFIAKSNNKKNALKYYHKIDSLFLATKNYYSSQKPAYKFLANYYKEKKDDKKQLEYINKYITVDSVLNARSKSINKNLKENYDIPNLLAEKEIIEKRLKQEVSSSNNWIIGITSISLVLLLFLMQQARRRKHYKERFQQLMNSPSQIDNVEKKTHAKKEQTISQAVIENISTQLDLFEKNQDYLSTEITLSSLAKTFETNSKYLSQVINQQKEQSFNNYINGLRIKYTVEKLKTDVVFRKYSIKAIANEVGFNTTESFSKAFYKNTGIRPSFFIKELEN